MQAYTLTHHLNFSGKGHLSLPIQCYSQAKLKILLVLWIYEGCFVYGKSYTNFVFRFTSNLLIGTQQIWKNDGKRERTIFRLLRARNVFLALVLSLIHTLLTLTGSEHQSGGCVSHRRAQNTRDVPLCYEWKIIRRHRGALPWHAAKGLMDATYPFSKNSVEMLKLLLLFLEYNYLHGI